MCTYILKLKNCVCVCVYVNGHDLCVCVCVNGHDLKSMLHC